MGVGKKAIRSTIFVAIGTYSLVAVSFATSIILARLLAPEYFGIVALGGFFIELFGRVREFGFDQALVHRQKDPEKAYSTHFILNSFAFFLSFLLSLIASPILLKFYDSQVVVVFLILSFLLFLKGTSQTPRIYLEKELAFGRVVLIDFVALLLSCAISVSMAFKGYTLSAVVAHTGLLYLFTFIGFWLTKPPKLSLKLDKETAFWFMKFGGFLWIGGFATFVLFKFNDFLAGTFLGAAVLGYYSKAFNLAQLPNSFVTSIASRVALPTYAKLQGEKEKLADGFNLILRNIVRISVPIALILFLVSGRFVLLLFGEKWLPMVPILRVLSVYAFSRAIFDDAGAFLTAIGRPNVVSKYLSLQAILTIIISPLLAWKFGVFGLTLGLDLVLVLGVLLAYYFLNKEIKVDFLGSFFPSFLVAIITTLGFYFFESLNIRGSLFLLTALDIFFVLMVYTLVSFILNGKSVLQDLVFLKNKFKAVE